MACVSFVCDETQTSSRSLKRLWYPSNRSVCLPAASTATKGNMSRCKQVSVCVCQSTPVSLNNTLSLSTLIRLRQWVHYYSKRLCVRLLALQTLDFVVLSLVIPSLFLQIHSSRRSLTTISKILSPYISETLNLKHSDHTFTGELSTTTDPQEVTILKRTDRLNKPEWEQTKSTDGIKKKKKKQQRTRQRKLFTLTTPLDGTVSSSVEVSPVLLCISSVCNSTHSEDLRC